VTARQVASAAGGWWADCELCETFHDGPQPDETTAVQAAGRHDDGDHHAHPAAAVHPDTTAATDAAATPSARAGRR
jgi:hypothetical protein